MYFGKDPGHHLFCVILARIFHRLVFSPLLSLLSVDIFLLSLICDAVNRKRMMQGIQNLLVSVSIRLLIRSFKISRRDPQAVNLRVSLSRC